MLIVYHLSVSFSRGAHGRRGCACPRAGNVWHTATAALCSLKGNGFCGSATEPNDLSFCEKKGLLDFQRKKAHRHNAIYYFRRASGYSQRFHRTLPLLFCLRYCPYPHWAATAPLIAAPAAREVKQRYRNSIEQRQRKEGLRLSSDRTAVDRTWYLADAA